jgi:adenosine/AMP kinase
MQLKTVKIEKSDDSKFILGQTRVFIKSVEDIHEALVAAVPGIKFGLALLRGVPDCAHSGLVSTTATSGIRWVPRSR